MNDDARSLLSRALSSLSEATCTMLVTPWFILEVLRYGTEAQLKQMSKILRSTDTDEIMGAFGDLLDGATALGRGDIDQCVLLAGRAEAVFQHVGFKYFEAAAMELSQRIGDAKRLYAEIGAITDATRLGRLERDRGAPAHRLTPRQQDVVRLIVRGYALSAIASKLGISKKTAEHHLSAAMQSIGVHRRSELKESPYTAHLAARA